MAVSLELEVLVKLEVWEIHLNPIKGKKIYLGLKPSKILGLVFIFS